MVDFVALAGAWLGTVILAVVYFHYINEAHDYKLGMSIGLISSTCGTAVIFLLSTLGILP